MEETPQKSDLRLNQFGASLGGPLVNDKVFYVASYEGYRLAVRLAPELLM